MITQVDRVIELQKLNEKKGIKKLHKVFSFTSGKGGTGKTVLALNLAYALSKQNKKVLLIDLDSNMSNVDIMLNYIAQKTIGDFYSSRSLLNELITEYEPNFHIIFGDSGKINYDQPKVELVKYFISQMEKIESKYDFIFLDTSAGANETLLNLLNASDYLLFVTNPEPTAVMDAYVMLKLLRHKSCKAEKLVIVNKINEKAEGEQTFNNLQTASGHFLNEELHYLGALPFSIDVNKSIIAQQVLVKKYPESKITRQIAALSKKIVEITQVANIHQLS